MNTGGEQPPPDNGNDNGNSNSGGDVQAEMITPATGFGLSILEEPVSFFYSVDESATDVRGYYVPVEDGSTDSDPIGERVITTGDLSTGVMQVLFFDPQEAGVGFYRLGIEFSINGEEEDAESEAAVEVQGAPDPIFILPSQSITSVTKGQRVTISFDVQDPEDDVQWRLFYLSESDSRSNPADQLGTALATGSGNAETFSFDTDSLEPGDYQLGISATDSGSSIEQTVERGESYLIVTIPSSTVPNTPIIHVIAAGGHDPPSIEVTAPGVVDESIVEGTSFTIQFVGEVNEPGATGSIELFYDSDNVLNNGFTSIPGATMLPTSANSYPFPTNVPEGTYYIGAIISDGVNEPVSDYSTGRLIVTPAP